MKILIPRVRSISRCQVFENFTDGKLKKLTIDLSGTLYLGSKSTRRYVVYDQKLKHDPDRRLGSPVTRIEHQIRSSKYLEGINISNLESWISNYAPFKCVRFASDTISDFEKPTQKMKLEYFRLLVNQSGYVHARKHISSSYPKYYRPSSFGRILKRWRLEKSYNLEKIFQNNCDTFFSAEPNTIDHEMFSLFFTPDVLSMERYL